MILNIKKMLSAGLSAFAALALAHVSHAQVLNIVGHIEVKGHEVLLHELVRKGDRIPSEWADRVVFEAPPPGVARQYSLQSIAYGLQRYGDMNSVSLRGAGNTVVRRAANVLDTDLVNKAVREYVGGHERWAGEKFQIAYGNTDDQIFLPLGRQSVEIAGFEENRRDPESLNFRVRVSVDGVYFDTFRVPARILPVTMAWFAVRPLRRGDMLSYDDIQLREVVMEGASRQYLTEDDDLSEFEVLRNIRAGDPVFRHMLVYPEYARRGDLINVTARKGNLSVRILATALAAGRKNDRIMCMNETTKRRFVVTLTGDRQGEIVLSNN